MKLSHFFLCLLFSILGCGKEESPEKEIPLTVPEMKTETISMKEHARILSEEKARFEELKKMRALDKAETNARLTQNGETIIGLERQIENLTELLEESRSQVSESKNSLKEIKKMGSGEYREIYERAKGLDHSEAVLLYEEFLEEFPNSPISSRARSRIKFHNAEIMVLENRKSARTVSLWESKLKGEGMFARAVDEEDLFELIGRKPDSAKRGTSSEYKERIYTWRDYVMDGGYRDLVIEATDGKVDWVGRPE